MDDFTPSEIMYQAATPFERAQVDADGEQLLAINAERVDTVWDPLSIDARLLPLLANAMGVNLYESDYWDDDTKRRWVADNWRFLALRGTMGGIIRALGVSGYTVQESIRPPQGFYASREMTKAEMDAWVRRMPEIRITYASRTGLDNGQFFADASYVEDDETGFAGYDDGPLLYGRFAVLRQNGVDTPLQTITETKSEEERKTTDFERYSMPGLSTLGFFADVSGADDFQFVDAEEVAAKVVTLRIDATYRDTVSILGLNTLEIGLRPLDVRHVTNSDIGPPTDEWFADDGFDGQQYAGEDNAARALADSVWLLDPSIAVPMTVGESFANVDRVGLPLKTAELMIDLHAADDGSSCFSDETFVPDAFGLQEDTSHVDRAIRAVEAARGHLDTVLVRFDTLRPLQVRDVVDEGTKVGAWVPNSL